MGMLKSMVYWNQIGYNNNRKIGDRNVQDAKGELRL